MKTSVALCTYNGEKYLKEQIDSILNQTKKVDEIVVCDDGSTDGTFSILEEYAAKSPEIFKIYRNETNLKSVKNFEKAISLCTGDVIFLSDQDDVWLEKKVETFLMYFDKFPETEVICSSGFAINDTGEKIDAFPIWDLPKLFPAATLDYFQIIAFIENIATGAAMAFRASIVNNILPIPVKKGFHHDEWIALLAASNGHFMMIEDQLFLYRIHKNQQVGGVLYENSEKRKRRLKNHFDLQTPEKSFSQYKKLLKRLASSYKKHQELLHSTQNENLEISKKIFLEAENLFHFHKKNMIKKFPVRSLFLAFTDLFNSKRKL